MLKNIKNFSLAIEAARLFNVNAVDCSLVLKVTCSCFVCLYIFVIPFFASFLYFFYLILFLMS